MGTTQKKSEAKTGGATGGVLLRQGDVLIIPIRGVVPDLAGMKPAREKDGRTILAHGEVTGHAHAIRSKAATLYRQKGGAIPGGRRGNVARNIVGAAIEEARAGAQAGALIADAILVASKDVVLRHQEHAPVHIPAGNYVVRIQREYAPGAIVNVAD